MSSRVTATENFFQAHGLWHIFSQNSAATSCRDAAMRRNRLGATGIPLYDELKSMAITYRTGSSTSTDYALIHCRAHQRFDLEKVETLLGSVEPVVRISPETLQAVFQARYGTVNPFSEAGQFAQIFDAGVLRHITPPHTMMTNAGDLTTAVEFEPEKVIQALGAVAKNISVSTITHKAEEVQPPVVFGIITGNGPESGMMLWQLINEGVYQTLQNAGRMRGDLSYPRVLIHSLPEMGLSMELAQRNESVWRCIATAVDQLIASGATHLTIACNTTPYFAPRIREHIGHKAVYVSIAEVMEEHIRKMNLGTASTLLGIPSVADMGEFSPYQALKALGVKKMEARAQPLLSELGYLVKQLQQGRASTKALNKLHHIFREAVDTPYALIALTEISVLLHKFPRLQEQIGQVKIIDALKLYAEALANIFLQSLPSESGGDFEWEE